MVRRSAGGAGLLRCAETLANYSTDDLGKHSTRSLPLLSNIKGMDTPCHHWHCQSHPPLQVERQMYFVRIARVGIHKKHSSGITPPIFQRNTSLTSPVDAYSYRGGDLVRCARRVRRVQLHLQSPWEVEGSAQAIGSRGVAAVRNSKQRRSIGYTL